MKTLDLLFRNCRRQVTYRDTSGNICT